MFAMAAGSWDPTMSASPGKPVSNPIRLLLLPFLLWMASCANQKGSNQKDRLTEISMVKIEVEASEQSLTVHFLNASDELLRIWDFSNSWGWGSIRFELQTGNDSGEMAPMAYLDPADLTFSRNGPGITEVEPGDQIKETFLLGPDDWVKRNWGWVNRATTGLQIRAVWNQRAQAEGAALGVPDLQATSAWILLPAELQQYCLDFN